VQARDRAESPDRGTEPGPRSDSPPVPSSPLTAEKADSFHGASSPTPLLKRENLGNL